MSPFPPPICVTFRRLSAEVERELADATRHHVPYREDAITSRILLELKRHHAHEVVVVPFSGAEEAQNGSDWEWWFVYGPWVWGMRLQAKILHPGSLSYRELHHRAGRHGYQINRLIKDAATSVPPRYPVFCFYNPGLALPATASAARTNPALASALAGITVADAVRVKQASFNRRPRTKRLAALAPLVLGWDQLVCPPLPTFPFHVPHVAEVLAERVTPAIAGRAIPTVARPTDAPPDYVQTALAHLRDGRPSDDAVAATAPDPRLAGAVVVQALGAERGAAGV